MNKSLIEESFQNFSNDILLDETVKLKKAKKRIEQIKKLLSPIVSKIESVGSVARLHPTVGDIDLVVVPDGDIKKYLENKKIKITSGKEKAISFTFKGIPVNLWTTPEESFGASVLHFSAGKGIIQLKQKAKSMGLTLNRYGLFKDGKQIAGKDYQEILKQLDAITKIGNIRMISDAVKNVSKKDMKKFKKQGQFPRITGTYYRFRQIDPNDFESGTFRITKSENGNARIVGKLKSGKWATQSIMINKKNIPEDKMNEYLEGLLK